MTKHTRLKPYLAVIIAAGFTAGAQAQLGTGWQPWFPTSFLDIESSNSHTSHPLTSYLLYKGAEYSCDSTTSTETFRILTTESNRLERRADEHYTSGGRQMEGDLKFTNCAGQVVHQLFHGSSGPNFIIAARDGVLRKYGGAVVLASGVNNVWMRYNNLNTVGGVLQIYINGVKKLDIGAIPQDGQGNNNKYGHYAGDFTGTSIVQWRNVKWYKDGGASNFKIINRNSGKALNVSGASTTNGAPVIQWSYGSGAPSNDEWQIVTVGSGYCRIMNRFSGKALVVDGGSTSDGANLVQWSYGSDAFQHDEWEICGVAGGYYKIINRKSGKAASVSGASTADGAQVVQMSYSADNTTNDEWQITNVP